jgi:membrane protein
MIEQRWVRLLRETWASYQRHNAQWLAAALAYFAAFAVAPLVIVVVEIAGFFLHAHQSVLDAIYTHMPGAGTGAVRQIVEATFNQPRHGLIAQIAGWAFVVFAALGLFGSLQFALNTVWDVPAQRLGLWKTLAARLVSFAMVIAVAALLILSVVANAALTFAAGYLAELGSLATAMKIADFALSFVLVWLLFAVLFEYLPDAHIAWRNVWLGSGLTALLFAIGQSLLGWYLARAGMSSAYGAFGSLVVFLLWANYSAQIFLLGAEFTRVYARWNESRS